MAVGTGTNDSPSATDDSVSVLHDRTLNAGAPAVLGNDTDPDLDGLTAALDSGPSNGALHLAPDGSFDYTPDPEYVGADSFTYHAHDGTTSSNVATVTIDVTDVAPVAVDDAYPVAKNTPISIGPGPGPLTNDLDPDPGESLTASLIAAPGNGSLSLSPDGSFDYSPDPGFSGADSFTYQVSDGALSSTASVALSVINATPIAIDDLYTGAKNIPLIVNAAGGVLANDSDPDGMASARL